MLPIPNHDSWDEKLWREGGNRRSHLSLPTIL